MAGGGAENLVRSEFAFANDGRYHPDLNRGPILPRTSERHRQSLETTAGLGGRGERVQRVREIVLKEPAFRQDDRDSRSE
jgi:hypothetical protein